MTINAITSMSNSEEEEEEEEEEDHKQTGNSTNMLHTSTYHISCRNRQVACCIVLLILQTLLVTVICGLVEGDRVLTSLIMCDISSSIH